METVAVTCRSVASPRTALARLRAAYPGGPAPDKDKRPIKELAFLLDLLKRSHAVTQDDVRQALRWRGAIPARGLSGWEEEALEWGRLPAD